MCQAATAWFCSTSAVQTRAADRSGGNLCQQPFQRLLLENVANEAVLTHTLQNYAKSLLRRYFFKGENRVDGGHQSKPGVLERQLYSESEAVNVAALMCIEFQCCRDVIGCSFAVHFDDLLCFRLARVDRDQYSDCETSLRSTRT